MSNNKPDRTLVLGMIAGLGVSLTSVMAASYFYGKKSTETNKLVNVVQEKDTKMQTLIEENAKLSAERNRIARLLQLAESSNVNVREEPLQTGRIMPAEIEKIRSTFNLIDTDQDGYILSTEIKSLHEKLGEPITDDEAVEAIAVLDRDGTGVNFDKFLLFWHESHRGGRRDIAYTNRFKLLSARLVDENFELSKVKRQPTGQKDTPEYRIRFYYKQASGALKSISPWHDVPLYHTGHPDSNIYNFICEIPKWTRAKFEISTGEEFNPIRQDVKNGSLRYMKYGINLSVSDCLFLTWEDPKHISDETKYPGDNDPIDVLEIGTRQLETGEIVPVKALGILALIDDKETDWKIIAININDPLAQLMNDIDDVETVMPGAIDAIRRYFRDYKSHDKVINDFGLDGQAMPKQFAMNVIELVHDQWVQLNRLKQTTVHK